MGTNHGGVNFGRRLPPIGGQYSTPINTQARPSDSPGFAGFPGSREDLRRRRGQRDGTRPGLGVAQPEFARLQPQILPTPRQEFVAAAAGQREQADRRCRVNRIAAAGLQRVQHGAEPAEPRELVTPAARSIGRNGVETALPMAAGTSLGRRGRSATCHRPITKLDQRTAPPPVASLQRAPNYSLRRRIAIAAAIGTSTRSGPLSQDRDHSTSVDQGRAGTGR